MKPRSEASLYQPTSHPDIELNRKTGIYYFRGTVQGRHITRSLFTKKFPEAKIAAQKLVASAITGESLQKVIQSATFDDAFDLLEKVQEPKAKKTVTMAKTQLKHLRPWFRAHYPLLKNFDQDYEEIWAAYRSAQGVLTPGRKLEHDRRHLVMALKRARIKGWIKRDFNKKSFELKEATVPIGEYIEDEDVAVVLRTLKSGGCMKTYLQVQLAVYMGMRYSEILELKVSEVDLKRREIHLDPQRLKIRSPRKVPIPIADAVYDLLKEHIEAAKGPYIFPKKLMDVPGRPYDWDQHQDNNRRDWKWVRDFTCIDVRFHDLRHTAITNALDGGLPDLMAEKIFGATRDVIQRVYDHLKKDRKASFRQMFNGRF